MEALAANGTTNIQTSVTGVTASKRRFIDDRRDQPFDKRLRFSVRQTESAYRYRDIVVRKQDGFTHILLSTKSSENNSLNPEVRTILIWEGVGGRRGSFKSLPHLCLLFRHKHTWNKTQGLACKMLHIQLSWSVSQLSFNYIIWTCRCTVSYRTRRFMKWNSKQVLAWIKGLAAYAICCPNYRNAEWAL